MTLTTLIALCLIVGTFALSRGAESKQFEAFIEDIIVTWHLRSPTIIFNDDYPNMCMTYQWLLCLSNDQDDGDLSNHLASLHNHRKQDGIIFIGFEGHEKLLEQLSNNGSTILTSNYPVFMPFTYQNKIKLRLDSNVIFYRNINVASFELNDVFAVKGGHSITLDFGNWNFGSGFILKKSMNRWERRTDLQGTRFINCFAHNPPSSMFIKDKSGNIIGSEGYYQDILFYVTDRLNVTIKIIEAEWKASLINGSWNGPIGFLQRQEADIVTNSLGINLQRSAFIDYPIKMIYRKVGLSAILPIKGTSPNMWVYIRVFGFNQWMIFITLLILIVMGLTVIHASSEDQSGREFGTKRGSKKNHRLNSPSSALAMAFLYTLQMGSHINSKQLAPRLLTLTMSILTLLLFAFFTTDITAEMTSGPPEIPIRTFEDVLFYNYKVVAISPYYERLLSSSAPGSAKRKVFDNHFEMKKDMDEVISEMIGNSKTLFFGPRGFLITRVSTRKTHKAFALKMDDPFISIAGLGLQKDSEFLPLFNHFILKIYENGFLFMGNFGRANRPDPEENFEMMEPQPLGLNNVMFCFISLGIGICVSIINVLIELMIRKTSKKRVVAKTNEREDAPGASGQQT